jgi:hypothetical protein
MVKPMVQVQLWLCCTFTKCACTATMCAPRTPLLLQLRTQLVCLAAQRIAMQMRALRLFISARRALLSSNEARVKRHLLAMRLERLLQDSCLCCAHLHPGHASCCCLISCGRSMHVVRYVGMPSVPSTLPHILGYGPTVRRCSSSSRAARSASTCHCNCCTCSRSSSLSTARISASTRASASRRAADNRRSRTLLVHGAVADAGRGGARAPPTHRLVRSRRQSSMRLQAKSESRQHQVHSSAGPLPQASHAANYQYCTFCASPMRPSCFIGADWPPGLLRHLLLCREVLHRRSSFGSIVDIDLLPVALAMLVPHVKRLAALATQTAATRRLHCQTGFWQHRLVCTPLYPRPGHTRPP